MSAKTEAIKQAKRDGYVIVRQQDQPIVQAWAKQAMALQVPAVIVQLDRPGWASLIVMTAHIEGEDVTGPIRGIMRDYLPKRKLVTIVEHNPVTTLVMPMPIYHARQLAAAIIAPVWEGEKAA